LHSCLAENALAAQRASTGQGASSATKGSRPKGAVIGAKPQYNSQGLLAAVQQLSVSASTGRSGYLPCCNLPELVGRCSIRLCTHAL